MAEKKYHCGSSKCLINARVKGEARTNSLWVVKDIPKDHPRFGHTMECPTCGSVLVLRSWNEKSNSVYPSKRTAKK